MTETVDYGRLWFSPWQMNGNVEETVALLVRKLGFGSDPQINATTGRWFEIYAEGNGVEGLLVDADGLVADAQDVLAAMDPVFDQNIPLTCRGIRYTGEAIINSIMTINRIGNVLSCSIERTHTNLETGLRTVLMSQSAESGRHENVLQFKAASY